MRGGGCSDITDNEFVDINAKVNQSVDGEIAIVDEKTSKLVAIVSKMSIFEYTNKLNFEKLNCRYALSGSLNSYSNNLNRYAYNINSQNGEDGIIEQIFEVIGTGSKYAVEFGGWDGIYLSNIRNLIIKSGFSGLFIEGDSDRIKDCIQNYSDFETVSICEAFVDFEGENKLDNILTRNNVPLDVDLISIDIDGYDYHVWDAMEKYKPRVIVIEYNPTIANDIYYVNPKDHNIFHGNSALALVKLGFQKGYSLISVTACNLIFVLDEEYEKFGILDNSLENLRHKNRASKGKFFQTYDGHLLCARRVENYKWQNGKKFPATKEIQFKEI